MNALTALSSFAKANAESPAEIRAYIAEYAGEIAEALDVSETFLLEKTEAIEDAKLSAKVRNTCDGKKERDRDAKRAAAFISASALAGDGAIVPSDIDIDRICRARTGAADAFGFTFRGGEVGIVMQSQVSRVRDTLRRKDYACKFERHASGIDTVYTITFEWSTGRVRVRLQMVDIGTDKETGIPFGRLAGDKFSRDLVMFSVDGSLSDVPRSRIIPPLPVAWEPEKAAPVEVMAPIAPVAAAPVKARKARKVKAAQPVIPHGSVIQVTGPGADFAAAIGYVAPVESAPEVAIEIAAAPVEVEIPIVVEVETEAAPVVEPAPVGTVYAVGGPRTRVAGYFGVSAISTALDAVVFDLRRPASKRPGHEAVALAAKSGNVLILHPSEYAADDLEIIKEATRGTHAQVVCLCDDEAVTLLELRNAVETDADTYNCTAWPFPPAPAVDAAAE